MATKQKHGTHTVVGIVSDVKRRDKYKEWWKFEVVMRNGDIGDMFSRHADPHLEEGDIVRYEIHYHNNGPYHKIKVLEKDPTDN